ncbi:MAG: mandelate racemase/muconate lactonizing enzyme family protein [Chloroflexi bacterium]|nr:mandelate racemase/muconate lactonizing enzyme family protein [Chloroflexota bacterium]
MRIEAIDLFYVALPKIERAADGTQDSFLVRVRADNGLYGWGEADASPLVSLAAYICPMSHSNIININEALLGETVNDPDDVRRLRAKAGAYGLDIQQIDHAVAAVDIALWDLVGKHLQEPVYRLLGYRLAYPKLPYASVLFGDTPAETREIARSLKDKGFSAAKFGWGPMGKVSLENDVALVAAARDGLGRHPELMIDCGVVWGQDDGAAYERAVRFADSRITWMEEPLHPDAVDAYRRLKDRRPPVRLAAGEGCDFFRSAEDLMTNGGVDFVQIDVGRIGGITVADQVCRRARELGLTYVNHTFKSHLQLAASIHVHAGIEQFRYLEYPAGGSPLILGLTAPTGLPVNQKGMVDCPENPGLGVDVNLETVRKYQRQVRIEIDGKVLFESKEP